MISGFSPEFSLIPLTYIFIFVDLKIIDLCRDDIGGVRSEGMTWHVVFEKLSGVRNHFLQLSLGYLLLPLLDRCVEN